MTGAEGWWLDLVQKLGGPIAGAVIVLILGGRGVWVFGRELVLWKQLYEEARARESTCKAEYQARLDAAERRATEWQEQALSGGYIVRQAVESLRRDHRPAKDRP